MQSRNTCSLEIHNWCKWLDGEVSMNCMLYWISYSCKIVLPFDFTPLMTSLLVFVHASKVTTVTRVQTIYSHPYFHVHFCLATGQEHGHSSICCIEVFAHLQHLNVIKGVLSLAWTRITPEFISPDATLSNDDFWPKCSSCNVLCNGIFSLCITHF